MKKSFIIYTDTLNILDELDDEQAGRLFKAIKAYHLGDANAGGLLNDIVTRLAFIPFKSGFERDNEKYNSKVERLRNNVARNRNEIDTKSERNRHEIGGVNDNVNVNDNVIIDTPVSNDTSVSDNNLFSDLDKSKSTSFENDTEAKIQKEIIQFFNETIKNAKSQIPAIKKIEGQRKGFLNARLREYGKDAVLTAIKKAAESDFLNGCGNKAFVASFDWIFRPTNFPKVLEGNYDNKEKKPDMSVGVVWHKKGEDYYKETKENLW